MSNNFSNMNPLHGVYSEFKKILNNIIIKYNYLAEKYETFEIKKEADMYISAKEGTDSFYTYRDYSIEDFYDIGVNNISEISIYTAPDGYLQIPKTYHEALLKNRRKKILYEYEESNEYYRMLNGQPPKNTNPRQFHYVPEDIAKKYGIDRSIPIHKIQDHYNYIDDGKGDYLISVLDGLGILDKLKETYPDQEYLQHLGNTRIAIEVARNTKNFQLLYVNQSTVGNLIFDEFIRAYEQARDYFVSVIFIREHRDVIPYYDQFIALCILCMALEIVLNRQFNLGIERNYYNNFTIKMLYDAYGVPYNMNIDEYTQRDISQNLNLWIQNKSTDKVLLDIAKILGFDNLKIYKYYLTKERKFDNNGVPIFSYTEKFNTDTGEIERIPNYQEMYDLYFQKVDITDNDFVLAYNDIRNKELYEEVTEGDPFWWEDEGIYNSVWETDYNIIEAKYLSMGISYKMTDIMYETILLLKLLIDLKEPLSTITFTLPKIDDQLKVTLFDAIMLLFCLTSKKHHLGGEIISIPTQVTSVLDYLHNTDGGDEFLVDSFGFNFDFFEKDNNDGQKLIFELKQILGEDEATKFMGYIQKISKYDSLDGSRKIETLNEIFTNVKGLAHYLQFLMTKAPDRETYEALQEFYRAVYYSKEVKSIFTINENDPELKRTAKTYFEFLYYHNPKLYSIMFTPNFQEQYHEYITKNDINASEYTLKDYIHDIDYGNIEDFTYSTLNTASEDIRVSEDLLYYYIDHIISRMENYIKDMKHIYMINDSSTPLEILLVKLVNFFKSFTVDMLDLEITYIIDLKAENTLRMIEEIASMCKTNEIRENMHITYKDILHQMEAVMTDINSELSFTDKVIYNAYILLAKDSDGNKYNFIDLKDMISYIESSIELVSHPSDNMLMLYDILTLNKSNVKLTDDMIDFIDKVMYKAYLLIDKDSEGDRYNHVEFKDLIDHIKTRYEIVQHPSENIINLFDTLLSNSVNIQLNNHNNRCSLFKDRIATVYYEDHDPIIEREFAFFDKVFTEVILKLTKVYDKETGNQLSLNDKFKELCIEYSLTPRSSSNSLYFNDIIHNNSFIDINENKSENMFKDRVVMRYYS